MQEEHEADMGEMSGVQKKFYERFPVKVASYDSIDISCAICLKTYKQGDKVFFLPCQHCFHVPCIMPWFNSNHVCPQCRYDLNEGQEPEDEK